VIGNWRSRENVVVEWFYGFGLTEPTPDHTVFTRARSRVGTQALSEIFANMRNQLKAKGCVSAGPFNSPKIPSPASKFRIRGPRIPIFSIFWTQISDGQTVANRGPKSPGIANHCQLARMGAGALNFFEGL
jgi:hypothetical protein